MSAISIASAPAWSRRDVGSPRAPIGPTRLVTATLAQPWLAAHGGAEDSWRFDPKLAGGGLLADAGDHLIDAFLWTTGQNAVEVAAIQHRLDSGLDLVTAAALRLADGTPATLVLSGVAPAARFELTYFGEQGRLHATDRTLVEELGDAPGREVSLTEPAESIDGNSWPRSPEAPCVARPTRPWRPSGSWRRWPVRQ